MTKTIAKTRPGEHWDNAKVIAGIPEDRLVKMTVADFEAAGVQM